MQASKKEDLGLGVQVKRKGSLAECWGQKVLQEG